MLSAVALLAKIGINYESSHSGDNVGHFYLLLLGIPFFIF